MILGTEVRIPLYNIFFLCWFEYFCRIYTNYTYYAKLQLVDLVLFLQETSIISVFLNIIQLYNQEWVILVNFRVWHKKSRIRDLQWLVLNKHCNVKMK